MLLAGLRGLIEPSEGEEGEGQEQEGKEDHGSLPSAKTLLCDKKPRAVFDA
jgi:hypothetical protein